MRSTAFTFISLLVISWVLELVLGSMLLRWFWGTAWFSWFTEMPSGGASLAQTIAMLVNATSTLTGNAPLLSAESVIQALLIAYMVVHVCYALWAGLFLPRWQRWVLGARRPSSREQEAFDKAYRRLAHSAGRKRISRPRAWRVTDGMGLQSHWVGYVLIVDRELIHHQYFTAMLAHELGNVNSEDRVAHRLHAMLPQPTAIVACFAGFPIAIGHVLTYPLWAWYWRSRIFAADRFAVRLGQGHALVAALDTLYLKLDTTTRGGRVLKPVPYVESRIDRMRREMSSP